MITIYDSLLTYTAREKSNLHLETLSRNLITASRMETLDEIDGVMAEIENEMDQSRLRSVIAETNLLIAVLTRRKITFGIVS
ncbi:hypothetical protein [Flavobacterium silvaticum]|uniref:Uncharacterized protein n=1 Tax=Flavobacterium silvaticum TaxID=1852020 RepID=A0A972FW49_9FLAO|nr:hypothetical protein [Flavobacterium silvaticum]NMH28715.1 hypothetical protein [Flavobacterium silvaticum]